MDIHNIEKIYEKTLKTYHNFDKTNMIQVLHFIMETVENLSKTSNIKGEEKKNLAIASLNFMADKQNLKEEEKFELKALINVLAPSSIDTIISIGNGVSNLVKKNCFCF
jgi:hypothetical protein